MPLLHPAATHHHIPPHVFAAYISATVLPTAPPSPVCAPVQRKLGDALAAAAVLPPLSAPAPHALPGHLPHAAVTHLDAHDIVVRSAGAMPYGHALPPLLLRAHARPATPVVPSR